MAPGVHSAKTSKAVALLTIVGSGFSMVTGVACAVGVSVEAYKRIVLKEEPVDLAKYTEEIVGFQNEIDKYQMELKERSKLE